MLIFFVCFSGVVSARLYDAIEAIAVAGFERQASE